MPCPAPTGGHLPHGFKMTVPTLFFPLGLHNLHLSQCPGGHLPTLLFTNTPNTCPGLHSGPWVHGYTQPLNKVGGLEAGF